MAPTPARTDRARAEVAKRDEQAVEKTSETTMLDVIKRQADQLARALPSHMNAERFLRAVLTTCRTTPALLDCTQASMLGAMMLSGQLGLEPGPLGHAYYVPFKNNRTGKREVQFIAGYKGLMDLAYRSGEVSSIKAEPVFDGDEFSWSLGLRDELVHRPTSPHVERTDPKQVTHVYAIAWFRDEGRRPAWVVLTRAQVEAARARSKAKDGPWVTDWIAMARKTAIRRLATWLPLSVELATAVNADERVIDVASDGWLDIAPDDVIDVDDAHDETGAEDTAVSATDGGSDPAPPAGSDAAAQQELGAES